MTPLLPTLKGLMPITTSDVSVTVKIDPYTFKFAENYALGHGCDVNRLINIILLNGLFNHQTAIDIHQSTILDHPDLIN